MNYMEERNIAIQEMLEDCKGWDDEILALREAFSRGEEFKGKQAGLTRK